MKTVLLTLIAGFVGLAMAEPLRLNQLGYLETNGLNVTSFADIYPDGHQTGVTVIQHGERVAANGDVRLEVSPGQWSPVPAGGKQSLDWDRHRITQTLSYPDPAKNRKGFNPIEYPDLELNYSVHVEPADDQGGFRIVVDLSEPLPAEWVGKVGFNFELFPTHLFGKAWLMNEQAGIFPNQPNGPLIEKHGEILAEPLAVGTRLVIAPESTRQTMIIESKSTELTLWDGRTNHNNGWYIVRSLIPAGASTKAIEWTVKPNVIDGWQYQPVIQVSQV